MARTKAKSSGRRLALWGAMGIVGATGCLDGPNRGVDPPMDELFFVTGILLEGAQASDRACSNDDPTQGCEAGQACVDQRCQSAPSFMIAANANSKREFNGSTLAVFDLQGFLNATGIPGIAQDPASVQLLEPGQEVDQANPCRRDAAQSRIVECAEKYFARPQAGVVMGMFTGNPSAMTQVGGQRQILVPVRGEPSITVVDVQGRGDSLALGCAQDPDTRRCDAEHKLRAVRDRVELGRLPMHPRSIVTEPTFSVPLAVLAHDSRPELTVVGFEGTQASSAMILDTVPLLAKGVAGIGNDNKGAAGGSSLAIYPCKTAAQGGDPPMSTRNCTQPLIYASYRNRALVDLVAVSELKEQSSSKASCVQAKKAGVSEFGCGVGLRRVDAFATGSLIPGRANSRDMFGSGSFSPDGAFYYLVQRSPGALLRFDTRVDAQTQMPKNSFAGAIDVCATASDLLVYSGQRNYALVSCRDAAQVYVVDIDAFALVKAIDVGPSPSGMVADPARELVYIPNFMNNSVSVLDMSETRPTRHSVVARLGLPEDVN